jgi:DNA-binding MarR family transcriptional regulator
MADEINNQVLETLFKLVRNFKGSMSDSFKHSHSTMLQCEAMMCIKKHKNSHMGDIAQHFSTTMPTATALIDKLIGAKYVKRENDPTDRRVVRVNLTNSGEKLLDEAMKHKTEKMNKLLSYLPEQDKLNLLRILNTLAEKSETL